MRIALFTDTFPPQINGVSHSVVLLAQSLVRLGHTVRVYAPHQGRTHTPSAHQENFTVKYIYAVPAMVYTGERVAFPVGLSLRDVRAFKPDIIHAHTPFGVGWEALWAARHCGVPLVGTHHTFFNHYLKHIRMDYQWAQKISWKYTLLFYNHCNLVISPTRSLADELKGHGLRVPIRLVPNAIDSRFFAPRETLSTRPTAVYIGRLSYEKSVDILLNAFAQVVNILPEAVLHIVGDGPERENLEKLCLRLNLSKHVYFTGFLRGNDLLQALQKAWVCVTASKSENMPLAILEAMAVGIPIVAVPSLGMQEIVDEGKNGLFAKADSPHDTAKKILIILTNAELRQELSKGAKDASRLYTQELVIEKVLHIYHTAMGKA